MTPANIRYLLAYIAEHGFIAFYRTGKLLALNVYTKRENGKVVTCEEFEEIEPTLAAVRAWLGY
jgi:hypothetical protein